MREGITGNVTESGGQTMSLERYLRDEAVAWHVRLADPAASSAEWAAFTDWLEADPAHAEAYDAIAMADTQLTETLATLRAEPATPQNDNTVNRVPWYRQRALWSMAGGGAAVALAVFLLPAIFSAHDLTTYQTRPGETRDIALNGGSHIALNGGTRLELDTVSGRFARLEAGEAVFTIHHDAARPFVLETPDATLRDIGTIFNVRQNNDSLEITVAQGAVHYNPDAEAVMVSAGSRLHIAHAGARPSLSKADPASVASWRQGQLAYSGAPLTTIAVDLTRSLGTSVSIAPELAGQRFTGVIRIERDQEILFRRLASLLGVHARHTAAGWQLTS